MAPSPLSVRHHPQPPPPGGTPRRDADGGDTPAASSPKGQHYGHTLDLARRLSLFTVEFPAEAKTGAINRSGTSVASGMDWSELLRKFRKHNPDRRVTAACAQTDQVLHQLLSETRADVGAASTSPLPPLPPILASTDHPAALTSLAALEATLESATRSSHLELSNAKIVAGFARYLVGEFDRALDDLARADLEPPLPRSGGPVELYDLTLRVLGNAVRGFSLERLNAPLAQAREAYRVASRQYDVAVETISKSTQTPGARDDVSLHRIGETVLWRLCHLDLAISSPHLAYSSHLAYIRQSSLSRSQQSPSPYTPARSLVIHSQLHSLALATSNHHDFESVNRARQTLLRETTTLPKAGQVNREYLEFLDHVVDRWRVNGSNAVEAHGVIEILYDALSHTFQSQRLLRYLVRTLTVATRYVEAAKALKLYLELWDKARETDAKRVAREMKRLRRRSGIIDEEKQPDDDKDDDDEEEHDIDTDRQWIDTAAFGVRLLCRYVGDAREAVRLAKRMNEIWQQKDDGVVQAKIETSLGIALASLAYTEANPVTRPAQHASALAHLERAATLAPTSFYAQYHLAYALLELRQVSRAFEVAKRAVEVDKRDGRGWHLLGLILTAMKDMKGALQVFETAIDLDLDDDDDDGRDEQRGGGDEGDALAKLEGTKRATTTRKDDAWDHPETETEKLGIKLQLRLSKNALVEYLEGPGPALEDQREILAWFAKAYAPVQQAHQLASHLSSPDSTTTTDATSATTLSKRKSLLGRRVSLRSKRDSTASAAARSPTTTTLSVPAGLSPASASPSPYASAAPSRAQSRNPSTVSLSKTPPDGPPTTTTTDPEAARMLAEVWLASAASFRRAGKLEESRGAISEAERLDPSNPNVWSQLASIEIAKGDKDVARASLQKAFSFQVDHLASIVLSSRLYLSSPSPTLESEELPFAESLLDTVTKKRGWDCPEAWFELSKCYKSTARFAQEKECLVWALQLEETRSLRSLDKCLERIP